MNDMGMYSLATIGKAVLFASCVARRIAKAAGLTLV